MMNEPTTSEDKPLEQRLIGRDLSEVTPEEIRTLRNEGFSYLARDVRAGFGCTTLAQGTILKLYCSREDCWKDQDRKTTPFKGVPVEVISYEPIRDPDAEIILPGMTASKLPLRYL